jgi:hypothetical protein
MNALHVGISNGVTAQMAWIQRDVARSITGDSDFINRMRDRDLAKTKSVRQVIAMEIRTMRKIARQDGELAEYRHGFITGRSI